MSRPTDRLHVALVVPAADSPHGLGAPDAGAVSALFETLGARLVDAGARVDLLPLGDVCPDLPGARRIRPAAGPPVGPVVLAAGYRLADQLARSGAEVVVAPAAGGVLWAVAAQRRQGAAFAECAFVPVGPPGVAAALRAAGARTGSFADAVAGRLEAAIAPLWADVPATVSGDTDATASGLWAAVHEASPSPLPDPVPVASVTAAVTHYERPVLLRRAVDSLLEQTRLPDEIVVVDDGSSTPAAIALLAELDTLTLPVPLQVVRQRNAGPGAARNRALAVARSEAVIFLDDDDEAEPTYLARLAGALAATGAAAAVVGFKVFPGATGPMAGLDEASRWLFCAEAAALAVVDNVVGGAAAMFRRDRALAVGGFDTQRRLAYEDWEILVRLVLAGERVESVPEALLRYRISEGSMLRTAPVMESHDLVLSSYAAVLPEALSCWPELLLGFGVAAGEQRDRAERAEAEAAGLARRLAECEAELAELRDADARLRQVEGSLSWRVGRLATGPVRRLSGRSGPDADRPAGPPPHAPADPAAGSS
jgi:GT2 family glycosyltransferase